MNNAARGVIFGLSLLGIGFMFFGMIDSASADPFKLEDLGGLMAAGFAMVSCAVIGAGALMGMKETPPKQVTFPFQQQAAVPPQAYPQPGTGPQAVPRQYQPPQQPQ
ncbi:hypothetical protein [Actinomadura chokoriensis]|uniref:Uncharacterized protein n=1 Tax=Actinomadura chokoriensis TaxID=454156 RepID=A0ABV4R1V1_9ACTN